MAIPELPSRPSVAARGQTEICDILGSCQLTGAHETPQSMVTTMNGEDASHILSDTLAKLAQVFCSGSWLIAEPVLPVALHRASLLRRMGASQVFALGAQRASGPTDDTIPYACLEQAATGEMLSSIRNGEEALTRLPKDIQTKIDAWDPTRAARTLRAFFSVGGAVAERPCWGCRDPQWLPLEDKTRVDALWDGAGIRRADSRVVRPRESDLRDAHEALDAGQGTVWAADQKEGWNGGAWGVRWVTDRPTFDSALAWMTEHATEVRVMPYLAGPSCSIHGIVFPDYVASLLPCEMIILRDRAAGRFIYAQAATHWTPPPQVTDAMRQVARSVGRYLQKAFGYRGMFSVDGVLTANGFLPTELNPRYAAGLNLLSPTTPRLDLYLLHMALVQGSSIDWSPVQLEHAILQQADANRAAVAGLMTAAPLQAPLELDLVRDHGRWRASKAEEAPHVHVSAAPSSRASMVRLRFDARFTPREQPLTKAVAEVLIWLSAVHDLRFGNLELERSDL